MSDSDLIAKAWTADHDIALMGRALGRPELVGRLLLYVGDAEGFLCTWPLGGRAAVDAGELMAVVTVARERRLERLHIWGPAVADAGAVSQLMWYVTPLRSFDCVMRVPLGTAALGQPARRRNKGRRRFQITTVEGFPGASVMSRLVEPYLNRGDVPPLQRALIGFAGEADLHDGCVSHLGSIDDGPAGIVVSFPLGSGVVVVRWALFDRQAKGVSDFLFRHVARFHRGRGREVLDLGYGGSATLYAYKRKLGAEPLGRPIVRWGVLVR